MLWGVFGGPKTASSSGTIPAPPAAMTESKPDEVQNVKRSSSILSFKRYLSTLSQSYEMPGKANPHWAKFPKYLNYTKVT
eukprot:5756148-Amphidinium_carterae.1